jgi:mannan endo-1,4-beta-mannosidase
VDFARLREHIRAAYERGGLNTVSWHSDNPLTGGDAWDRTSAVAAILPGGAQHELFLSYLDRVAAFLGSLRGPKGERIPILFRPFHEHTGDWFWWGSKQTDDAGYIALFRMTVDYLTKERGLDNLLIAYSPDGGRIFKKEDQLFRYPGDEYVDVIGLDYYFDPGKERFAELLTWLVEQAEAHGKVPALTEFGPRNGVNGEGIAPDFLSQKFLAPLLSTPGALRIAYALAWRNARPDHAYYPYPGHAGEADLRAVCEHPATLLTRDLAARH